LSPRRREKHRAASRCQAAADSRPSIFEYWLRAANWIAARSNLITAPRILSPRAEFCHRAANPITARRILSPRRESDHRAAIEHKLPVAVVSRQADQPRWLAVA
jgi:hypothetical protein